MSKPESLKLSQEEVQELETAIENNDLSADQKQTLKEIIDALDEVCRTLEQKRASIARLRKLFGLKTEAIPGDKNRSEGSSGSQSDEKKSLLPLGERGGLAISNVLQTGF